MTSLSRLVFSRGKLLTTRHTWVLQDCQRRSISAEALVTPFSILPPVLSTENVVLAAHSMGSGNWALDIMGLTFFARILLSGPVTTYYRTILASHAITCKDIVLEKRKTRLDINSKVKSGDMPESLAKYIKIKKLGELRDRHMAMIRYHNNHPGKAYVAIVFEVFCWVTYGLSLRNITAGFPPDIASEAALEMKSGGILWISDLTVPDPLYLIPCISTTVFLCSAFYMKEWRRQNGIPDFNILQRILPIPLAGFLFYISSQLPSVSPIDCH